MDDVREAGRRARGVVPTLLWALVAAGTTPARAQVSPGPLSRAHRDLDSNLKCFTCHGQRGQAAGSLPERCLACHKEIAALVQAGRGLHARAPKQDCARCHPEHAGLDFDLVHWDEGSPERFDHARAGWPLAGKHAGLACRACHRPELQATSAGAAAPPQAHAHHWVGLDRTCAACHAKQDPHRGALGKDCARCHGVAAWKPAAAFDHARTDYPLTGRHAKLVCDACHLSAALKLPLDGEGHRVPLYKPLPHNECSACHADAHAGRFGPACSRCHVTSDWKQVGKDRFDHDATRYPLRGRHVSVACAQCHVPKTAGEKRPLFQACGSCHADAHAGQAALAGRKVDCASCHQVQEWKPATYTVAQHAASAYPLEGKHATVRCDACHRRIQGATPGTAGVRIRMAHATCRDCHEDAHGTQLAKRPDGGACESCHRVDGWKSVSFTVAQHARLRLPLEGAHAKIACAACHGPDRPGLPALPGEGALGPARVAIVPREVACEACHFDPHAGKLAGKGRRPGKAGCLACHGTDSFRPSTMDVAAHSATPFPLEGGHGAIPCAACHAEIKSPSAASSLLLKHAPRPPMTFAVQGFQRCEACHQGPHGNQFAKRPDRGACASCHTTLAFKPASRFDHGRDAGFSLEGAHARVACARCHPARKDAAGRSFVLYRPVPKDCKSCHGERVPAQRSAAGPAREDRS